MPDSTIRAAELPDIGEIARLAEQWQAEGSTKGHVAPGPDYYTARIGSLLFVAVDGRQVVGYIAASRGMGKQAVVPDGSEFIEVEELYVIPTSRSTGIGTRLLRELVGVWKGLGVNHFHVFTGSVDLDRALAFYTREGFRPWSFQAVLDTQGAIRLRRALPADSEFAYRVKEAAFRGYVEQLRPWDEVDQRRQHKRRFSEQEFLIVELERAPVGVVALENRQHHVKLNQLFIAPDHQGQGIGAECLRHVCARADGQGVPVRLRCMKVNPRGAAFYERHGFTCEGETDTHLLMERPPKTVF